MRKSFIKIIAVFTAAVATFFGAGCKIEIRNGTEVNVTAVDGAPVLSLASVINAEKIRDKTVKVSAVKSPDNVITALLNKSSDIAVMPVNLAYAAYKKNAGIKMLSVNIFGNLYIAGKADGEITVTDLKDKKIGAVGGSGTPLATLKFLMGKDYNESLVQAVAATEVAAAAQKVLIGTLDYILAGEPQITALKSKGLKTVFDMQKAWSEKTGGKLYTQAGVAVRKEFFDSNKEFIAEFYERLSENADFLRENNDKLATVLEKAGSFINAKSLTSETLEKCNLGCRRASDIKEDIKIYLSVLTDDNSDFFLNF